METSQSDMLIEKMLDARETARRLLGDRYKERSGRFQEHIREIMSHMGASPAQALYAAIRIAEKEPNSSGQIMLLMSAFLDIHEADAATVA